MLIDTELLIPHHDLLCLEVVDSIRKGIRLEDDVPPIEVIRMSDLIQLYPEIPSIFTGLFFAWHGNHRAKAHDLEETPVEAEVRSYSRLNVPCQKSVIRHTYNALLGNAPQIFSEVTLESNPRYFRKIRRKQFYR